MKNASPQRPNCTPLAAGLRDPWRELHLLQNRVQTGNQERAAEAITDRRDSLRNLFERVCHSAKKPFSFSIAENFGLPLVLPCFCSKKRVRDKGAFRARQPQQADPRGGGDAVADSTVLPELLHGQERRVWGDQAYRGQRAVIRECAPKARDFTNRRYRHRGVVDEVERAKNRTKSKVRARVEHAIGVVKRVFGFAKVRYRGLNKNTHRLLVTCALANLFMARRHLLRCQRA